GDRRGVEPVYRPEQVIGFRDQLHIGIFDAVMHHLHIVAGATRADIGAAGRAIDLRRHLGHHRLDARIGAPFAAGHHARRFTRALLAARYAHADEAELPLLEAGEAALRIGEQRIAAVDHDVVGLEVRHELADHVVDRLAGLHHDDDRARL